MPIFIVSGEYALGLHAQYYRLSSFPTGPDLN